MINNFGGGIFGMLPVSQEKDVFDTHFATVHTHTLAPITQSMGINTYSVNNVETLNEALTECWLESGLHIIEAIVDKEVSKNHRVPYVNMIRNIKEHPNETLDHGC